MLVKDPKLKDSLNLLYSVRAGSDERSFNWTFRKRKEPIKHIIACRRNLIHANSICFCGIPTCVGAAQSFGFLYICDFEFLLASAGYIVFILVCSVT